MRNQTFALIQGWSLNVREEGSRVYLSINAPGANGGSMTAAGRIDTTGGKILRDLITVFENRTNNAPDPSKPRGRGAQ